MAVPGGSLTERPRELPPLEAELLNDRRTFRPDGVLWLTKHLGDRTNTGAFSLDQIVCLGEQGSYIVGRGVIKIVIDGVEIVCGDSQRDVEAMIVRAKEFLSLERYSVGVAVHQHGTDWFQPPKFAPALRLVKRNWSLQEASAERHHDITVLVPIATPGSDQCTHRGIVCEHATVN